MHRFTYPKLTKSSGYVLHHDPESKRVVIATLESDNEKTGNMIQIWILRSDINPVTAVKTGLDSSICGDCPLRGHNGFAGRTCYVRLDNAPLGIYRAFKRGKYPYLAQSRYAEVFTDRAVRFGAYGDPVHMPLAIIRWISFFATRTTGYTHQWRNPEYRDYRRFLMASVETTRGLESARAAGWRAFRVRRADEPLAPNEIMCPASPEARKRTQCERCGLCNGALDDDRRKHIAIVVHGVGAKNLIQIALAA